MKTYFIILVSFILLVTFQNCSDVKIEKIEKQSAIVALSKPSDSLCAPVGANFGTPMRIAIILDMSMSNLGRVVTETNNFNTIYSVDNTGASDMLGNRFLELKKFIQNCGGNLNVKYSIFGFSKTSLFVKGQSCYSEFETQAEAIKTLDLMKGLQDADQKTKVGINVYPFHLQDQTYYSVGLDCLKSKISTDVALLTNEKPVYHVFFVTDGQPTDPLAQRNYSDQIKTMNLSVKQNAASMIFQPVFYTSPGASNQGTEQATALATLNTMATALDPNGTTMVLSNLNQATDLFCAKLKPDTRVNYELKSFFAINLTSKMVKSTLVADSDMDGVSDDEETPLGWDPTDSRSTGILDGLCLTTDGDKTKCQIRLNNSTCSQQGSFLGLSECDLIFSQKMFGKALTGLDSDGDLIPDFIEIIRNTSPTRNDMTENQTGDGKSNYDKITMGLDIESSLDLFPVIETKTIMLNINELKDKCNQGEKQYSYLLDQIPLVKVKSFTDNRNNALVNLSHREDENVILIFYRWSSLGGIPLPDRLFVQKILISIDGSFSQETPQLLGDI